jgi:hypothetical protein
MVLGVLLVFTSKPRGPRYAACGRCRYDVGAILGSSATCPECGTPLAVAGVRTRMSQRRNVTTLVLGVLLILLGCAGLIAQASGRLNKLLLHDATAVAPRWAAGGVLPLVSYHPPLRTTIELPLELPDSSVRIDSLSREEALELLGEVARQRKRNLADQALQQRLKEYYDALMDRIRGT